MSDADRLRLMLDQGLVTAADIDALAVILNGHQNRMELKSLGFMLLNKIALQADGEALLDRLDSLI